MENSSWCERDNNKKWSYLKMNWIIFVLFYPGINRYWKKDLYKIDKTPEVRCSFGLYIFEYISLYEYLFIYGQDVSWILYGPVSIDKNSRRSNLTQYVCSSGCRSRNSIECTELTNDTRLQGPWYDLRNIL